MRKNPIGAVPVPARLDKPQVIVTFDREGIFAGCVTDVEDVPAGCTWQLEDMI